LIIGAPHRYLAQHSTAFRTIIFSLSSEQWTCFGFGCLLMSAFAGFFHHPYFYAALLCAQDISDINDGYVYQNKENGLCNGYGLYIDHILDSIGASFAALGGFFLLGAAPFACAAGLVLFYLIAIHSWLYKITKISEGQRIGAYYGVLLSRERALWLNVDDLTLVMAIIGISRFVPLLYLTDVALFVILVTKVVRTSRELRKTRWLSGA